MTRLVPWLTLSSDGLSALSAALAVDALREALAHPGDLEPDAPISDAVVDACTAYWQRMSPASQPVVAPSALASALLRREDHVRVDVPYGPDVLLPCCEDDHWRLLWCRPEQRTIVVYDSAASSASDAPPPSLAPTLRRALGGDAFALVPGPCVLQAPGSNDCALWTLANAEGLRRQPITGLRPHPTQPWLHRMDAAWMRGRRVELWKLLRALHAGLPTPMSPTFIPSD